MAEPVFSVVVLSWNRARLLQRTLDSLLATLSDPSELIVIDNGSEDGSRDVIQKISETDDRVEPILLEENQGGAALNLGLERARGRFIVLSENDMEFVPGWCERAQGVLERFPEIGQLSLLTPVQGDLEIERAIPQFRVIRRGGQVLYESAFNVGTSSILRREIVDGGVRLSNLENDPDFLFPNDMQLSHDIKQLGFLVCWSDQPLARNLGHQTAEVSENEDYYRRNYAAKTNWGVSELYRRIDGARDRTAPPRQSFLFPETPMSADGRKLDAGKSADEYLWSHFDLLSPNVESFELIYALTRIVKPERVLESRAWLGQGTVALARALSANGRGDLVTIALDEDDRAAAEERLGAEGLAQAVTVASPKAPDTSAGPGFDLVVLSDPVESCAAQFERIAPALAASGWLVAFCDAAGEDALRQSAARHDIAVREPVRAGSPDRLLFTQFDRGDSGSLPA